jgi:hypothetical protein
MNPTAKKHVVITGTGRAGTSFLVELLTYIGLDTGFDAATVHLKKNPISRAGLEHDVRDQNCPYVAKSPSFCEHAKEIFERNDIIIDHIFIPVRELNAAAESRRHVNKDTISRGSLLKKISNLFKIKHHSGGLWFPKKYRFPRQEDTLLRLLYEVIFCISNTQVPLTLLRYPRLAKDSWYLFQKVKPILGDIDFESFKVSFDKVARPELIHNFNKHDF